MTSSKQIRSYNRYELRNRYLFRGKIVMQTALHIGGGKVTLGNSDSPVVLTPDQKPFIPGSSFKGALRSTVEKIVPALPTAANLSSCALMELNNEELRTRKDAGQTICPTARQGEIARDRRENPGEAATILENALDSLCSTCRLFGSPFAAARLSINDLYIPEEEWFDVIQVRDGVAIDRDSEKARDRLKFDFEVVPASAQFALTIVLENATKQDLQLLCVGLNEFVHGFGVIGGKRSRGLGVAQLEDLYVSELVLENVEEAERNRRLSHFLIHRSFPGDPVPGDEFLRRHIESIFEEGAV